MMRLNRPTAPIAAAIAMAIGVGSIGIATDAHAQSRTATARAALEPAKTPGSQLRQQFVVRYHEGKGGALGANHSSDLLGTAGRSVGVTATHQRFTFAGSEVISVDRRLEGRELRAFLRALRADPRVSSVSEDHMLRTTFIPNDPRFDEQEWHYGDGDGGINAVEAWDRATGEGVVVAVVDSGYVPHADLTDNLADVGYDFISDPFISRKPEGRSPDAIDPGDWEEAGDCGPFAYDSSWHGTHVAGTIAALTDNEIGVAGVAFDSKVLPVRALGRCGGTFTDVSDAIAWAGGVEVPGVPDNEFPAQIINLSLGGAVACPLEMQEAIDAVIDNGASVVVSAGNSNSDAAGFAPANCDGVIVVGATNPAGGRSGYSNFGESVSLSAPGGSGALPLEDQVLSTVNTGTTVAVADGYEFYFGTSMSAPHVSGVAALMHSVAEEALSPDQVREILVDTSWSGDFVPGCTAATWCGPGIVDARFAVAVAAGDEDAPEPAPGPPPPPEPTEIENGETVIVSGAQGEQVPFVIDVPADSSNLVVQITGGTGDADLYVRYGEQPTLDVFDCAPFIDGNEETCTFEFTQEGEYFITLVGWEAFADVELTATYEEGAFEFPVLENGVPVAVENIEPNEFVFYQMEIPAGTTDLLVELTEPEGMTGDPDLFVRFGAPPTTAEYDCASFAVGGDETCVIENPEAGTWYVGVNAFFLAGPVNEVTLEANWIDDGGGDTGPSNLEVTTSGARMRPTHTLSWEGGASEVDVFRNGTLVYTGDNEGSYSESVNIVLGDSSYQVCNAGTDECSSEEDAP